MLDLDAQVVRSTVGTAERQYDDAVPATLPDGRYLSVAWMVRSVSGGQTRAMLLRSRAFSTATGRAADVLSIDAFSEYDQVRSELRASGLLSDNVRLLNLYEHYRAHPWGDERGSGEQLEPVTELEVVEIAHPDGSPWRKAYLDAARQVVLNDFLRDDGSVFLRAAPYHIDSAEQLPRELIRVAPSGEILGRFSSLGQWCHRWFEDLTRHDERTFLFTDSRQLVPVLAPIDDPSIHLIAILHSCHLPAPRLWNTPPQQQHRRCLEAIDHVDAFVTLTQRQREDIELVWGQRNNLAVVPSAVEMPAVPTPAPMRDPRRVVVIARLERVKRITHSLRVLERVVSKVPDAHLDIYGSGKLQGKLQALIEERGLSRHATLHGHDPAARETLWSASASLLTSEAEGCPLTISESLSRSCPVVSYDIPYGPREQITDGVDGFLVPDGDIKGAAERIVRLLSSAELVARLGKAGRDKAAEQGEDTYLANWAEVLNSVIERAPRRTRLTSTELTLSARTFRPARIGSIHLRLAGSLTFTGTAPAAGLARAVLTLVAVDEVTGARTPLALTTRDADFSIRFEARLDLRRICAELPADRDATLRLCFNWENSYWETVVTTDRSLHAPGLDSSAAPVVVLRHLPPRPPRHNGRRGPLSRVASLATRVVRRGRKVSDHAPTPHLPPSEETRKF